MDLKDITEELLRNLTTLKIQYEKNTAPENKKDKAYFEYVKKETTPIFDRLEKWEKEALTMTKERKINVHPQQIASTKENMELLLMHSFYMDVRRKRYMELYKSIRFIFDQIIEELS